MLISKIILISFSTIMPTKKCKQCQTEIDAKAKKCPNCQSDLRPWPMRHPIWTAILVLVVIGIIGSASAGGSSNSISNSSKSVPANADKTTTATTTATSAPKATPQTLLDISGNGTKTTQKFTAASDWDLNWSYDCSSFGSQGNFAVDVYNGDGTISFENAGVNQLGSKDTNVEHYHTGGTFYLVVNSECSWHITAKG